MKIKVERSFLKYCIYIFVLVSALIFVYKTLDNISGIISSIAGFLGFVWRLLLPFVIGFVIAYLLDPYVIWIEKHLFKNRKKVLVSEKWSKLLSIIFVYIIFIGTIILGFVYIIPIAIKNVVDLIGKVPQYYLQLEVIISEFLDKYNLYNLSQLYEYAEKYILSVLNSYDVKHIDIAINAVMRGVLDITTIFLHYILGFVIGFYFLMEKEDLKKGIKKFLRAIVKDETVEKWIDFAGQVNDIFSRFIVGRAIDSSIIGVLCFVGLMFLKVRYALLLSVIVGVTNMIPYFGPIIGAVPAVVITLFDSPIKALWVAIFIFILQQFDGMVLGPKIVGSSIGLSPLWIIFAIMVGGGVLGVVGMFLGVPCIAVIRLLLSNFIEERLRLKDKKNSAAL
ncbi:MAG: AI-2E family transporter [Clostridiaceae bacterium]|nr:AI-2E family transporter [Clostridiaceae bacterium]